MALANGKGAPLLSILGFFCQVRRLHDVGRSGWWALLAQLWPIALLLTPISLELLELVGMATGLAVTIAIGAVPGSRGENRFGPPPPTRLAAIFTRR